MFNKEEIANIILHVIIISTFIGIFFFTYASHIEENIVKKQVAFLIEDNKIFVSLLPNNYKQLLLEKLNNIKLNLENDDKKVTEANKKLLIKAIKVLSLLLIVGISIVWKMSKMYNFDIVHLLKENLVILCFVALTEFVFLTFFAQNYLSIDPNIIRRKMITIIGDNGNKIGYKNINNDKMSLNKTGLDLNNILNESTINKNIAMFKKKYDDSD